MNRMEPMKCNEFISNEARTSYSENTSKCSYRGILVKNENSDLNLQFYLNKNKIKIYLLIKII